MIYDLRFLIYEVTGTVVLCVLSQVIGDSRYLRAVQPNLVNRKSKIVNVVGAKR